MNRCLFSVCACAVTGVIIAVQPASPKAERIDPAALPELLFGAMDGFVYHDENSGPANRVSEIKKEKKK